MFIDHETGNKAYFMRRKRQTIKVAENYGMTAATYGLWDSVGAVTAFSYQLLICDKESSSNMKYSGFFNSGYTGECYKTYAMIKSHRTFVHRAVRMVTRAWHSTLMPMTQT